MAERYQRTIRLNKKYKEASEEIILHSRLSIQKINLTSLITWS
jgi:hypothetical protein